MDCDRDRTYRWGRYAPWLRRMSATNRNAGGVDGGEDRTAVKTHLRLLVSRQGQCGRIVRDRDRDQPAIKSPGQRKPRRVFAGLISQERRLLESLIVIGASHGRILRAEIDPSNLRAEEAGTRVSQHRKCRKAVYVGEVNSHHATIDLCLANWTGKFSGVFRMTLKSNAPSVNFQKYSASMVIFLPIAWANPTLN